jgi:hypothetical protein
MALLNKKAIYQVLVMQYGCRGIFYGIFLNIKGRRFSKILRILTHNRRENTEKFEDRISELFQEGNLIIEAII